MMLGSDGSMTQMNSGDLRRMRDQIPQGQQLHLQTQLRLEPQQQEEQEEHQKQQQDQQQQ